MEVCRVCLDLMHDNNFYPLDGVIKDMLSLLTPELNVDISDKPIICQNCSSPLEELFSFKSNFLKNEDKLEGKIDKNKDLQDLRDILKGVNAATDQIKAKEKFCRTCLELIDCNSFTIMAPSKPDIYLNCMFEMCLPEMDLTLTSNPLMCISCMDKIQKLHHLKSNCFESEKKINNYCELFGTNSSGQVNLNVVLESNIVNKDNLFNNGIFQNTSNIFLPDMVSAANLLALETKTEEKLESNGVEITNINTINDDKSSDIEQTTTSIKQEVNHEDVRQIDEVIIKQEVPDDHEMKEDDKSDIKKRTRRIVRRRTYKNVEVDTDEEESLQCKICNKAFATFSNLSRHKAIHQGEPLFKCDICQQKFNQKCALDKHRRGHTGEKPYVCGTCGKAFTGASNLSLHKRVHLEEKPFPCTMCPMRFTQRSNMKKHIVSQHVGEKNFECEICNKMFSTKHGVQSHMEIHVGEKPYKCKLCGEEFRHQNGLRVHRMLHYGKHPLTCDICGRQCLHQSALDNHRKTHSQEKPYQCEVCNKRFVKEWILKSHMTLHTGEKNFPCGVCGKKYADKSKLNFHLKKRCMKGIEIVPIG